MQSIRQRIALPLLLVCLVVPLGAMAVFNIAMQYYIERSTRSDLESTARSVKLLIREVGRVGGTAEELAEISQQITTLRSAIRLSELSENTELYVLDQAGNELFPRAKDDLVLGEEAFAAARAALSAREPGEIVFFQIDRAKYYATYKRSGAAPTGVQLLFIATDMAAYRFVAIFNRVYLCILLLGVALSFGIALSLSRNISRPIGALSQYARRIGDGEYLSLPENRTSREIYDLTRSMNEMSERLKAYDQSQRTLFQNASHELRTPLMSIQGYAEGIANGVFPDAKEAAELIVKESGRLHVMVEEQLTLSRLESALYAGHCELCDLNELVGDAAQRVYGLLLKQHKTLDLRLAEAPLCIQADETLFDHVLNNIVANCARYAQSRVTVAVSAGEGRAWIRVSDDGKGIDEQDLPHIFERYYRGSAGNMGLGLSIAKVAVEWMAGTVAARNENGAVFEISFPLS